MRRGSDLFVIGTVRLVRFCCRFERVFSAGAVIVLGRICPVVDVNILCLPQGDNCEPFTNY